MPLEKVDLKVTPRMNLHLENRGSKARRGKKGRKTEFEGDRKLQGEGTTREREPIFQQENNIIKYDKLNLNYIIPLSRVTIG